MAKVDPNKLDEVIAGSGVSARTADKLRRSNESPIEQSKPRGHGAPSAPDVSFDEL